MSTLSELLKLPPKEAARALVAKALKPGVDPSLLELKPQAEVSTNRPFTITISQKSCRLKDMKFHGSAPFTFDRLVWTDVFKEGHIVLPEDAPESTREVLTLISRHTGVAFDDDDVMDTNATIGDDGALTLLASPRSWRWCGTIKVFFNGAPAVIVDDTKGETLLTQRKDPTAESQGDVLYKLRRGQLLGYNARVWWVAANVAFDTPRKWVIDILNPAPFNGGGGRVLFNGLAKPDEVPAGLKLGRIPMKVQILLNRRLCKDAKGIITIFYSKPTGG